jgi:carbamoyl-phosphate synthase small subunit
VKKGMLVTADGSVFTGIAAGSDGVATGEVVFNTAMTGYQEIITDPSYAGQVVVMTAPHIGNYGSTGIDDQADSIHAKALVTRSMSRRASSWRSEEPFADYLTRRGIVALSDIDTRRLTRHIRDKGAMPVAVGSDIDESELTSIAAAAPTMAGMDLVQTVTTDEIYVSNPDPESEVVAHVVAYDLGIKRDILTQLNRRGVSVTVVPASTSADAVLAMDPDAVFLSNGPGDPEPLETSIEAVRGLLGRTPLFGICLGHQVLGLALGASTFKLPFGHHGGNHPVRNVGDGTVDITSQNHGFAVDLWSLTGIERPTIDGLPGPEMVAPDTESAFGLIRQTHLNLNDGTNEGLACLDVNAFSVQYHPEAAPGPNDAQKLFDGFVESIGAANA